MTIDGVCTRCLRIGPTNICTRGGHVVGDVCEDCFKVVFHDDPHRNRTCKSSGGNHNDPGLDNAIRAMEEDR